MPRRFYSLLLYVALPFAALRFVWTGWCNRANRGSLRERLGFALEPRADHPLWLHAASIGEVRSLAVLLRLLHRAGFTLLVTVGTPAGLATARQLYRDLERVSLQAAPWDLPGAVRRFLRAVQPNAGVFVETELWPNLLHAARHAGVPLGLVSARLSERSLRGYLRWAPGLMRDTVRAFTAIAAQTEADRERLVKLGADPQVVSVSGSLKAELHVPHEIAKLGAAWREQWAPQRPLWIAGSTHAGEESICMAAQQLLLGSARLRGASPPLLALAPRHPQRFDEVARELAAAGLAFARSGKPPATIPRELEVVLVDEMGALLGWYAAGDAAFVGGSLVPVGGHNLLEPAVLARPVLAGPHDANAPEVARRLRDAGGLIVVENAQQLAYELNTLFIEPQLARARGARASAGARPEELGSRSALELVRRLLAARSS